MQTQILITVNKDGLGEISLIARDERECDQVMETYLKFEQEISDFIAAMRKKRGEEINAKSSTRTS